MKPSTLHWHNTLGATFKDIIQQQASRHVCARYTVRSVGFRDYLGVYRKLSVV